MKYTILTLIILLLLLPVILISSLLGSLYVSSVVKPMGGWLAYADALARHFSR